MFTTLSTSIMLGLLPPPPVPRGVLPPPPAARGARQVRALHIADVDADGLPDKLIVTADGRLRIERNLGGGVFNPVLQDLPDLSAADVTDVLVSDLDGDGTVDLYLLANGSNVALVGRGAALFEEATERLGLTDSGRSMRARRVDLDGVPPLDLVLTNENGDVAFLARGARFERDPDSTPAQGPGAVGGPSMDGPEEVSGDSGSMPGSVRRSRTRPDSLPVAGKSAPGPGARRDPDPRGGALAASTQSPPFTLSRSLLAFLNSIFVNDDAGEVDSADVVDGSLTGADVSTNSGNVTFLNGMVGIGTPEPTSLLHLIGETNPRVTIANSSDPASVLDLRNKFPNNAYLNKHSSSGLAALNINVRPDDNIGDAYLLIFRDTNTSGSRRVIFYEGDGTPTVAAQIGMGGAPTYFGLTGGKVGIGKPNPGAPLEVVGEIRVGGTRIWKDQVDLRDPDSGVTGVSLRGREGVHDVRVMDKGGTTSIHLNGLTGRTTTGTLVITGGSDLVEGFDAGREECPPGTVVSIDPENAGCIKASRRAYDRCVAGVVSGANGVRHGLWLGQEGTLDGETPVAMAGRVWVRCTDEGGPIAPGDLLTTASTPGHAMRATDPERWDGAVLGKAMTALSGPSGMVLVLVNLQ